MTVNLQLSNKTNDYYLDLNENKTPFTLFNSTFSDFFNPPSPPFGGLGRLVTPLFDQVQWDLDIIAQVDAFEKITKVIKDLLTKLCSLQFTENSTPIKDPKTQTDSVNFFSINPKEFIAPSAEFTTVQCYGAMMALPARRAEIRAWAYEENIAALNDLSDSELSLINVLTLAKDKKNKTIEFLISRKINLFSQKEKGNNILHIGAINGNIKLFQLLQAEGLGLNSTENSQGFKPSHLAIFNDQVNLLCYFDSIGIKYEFSLGNRSNVPKLLRGATPMHLAALNGSVRMLTFLKEKGFKMDELSTAGMAPIHQIAYNEGYQSFKQGLLSNLQTFQNVFEWFAANGADVNQLDAKGNTILHYFATFLASGQIDIEIPFSRWKDYFIKFNLDHQIRNGDGKTAQEVCTEENNREWNRQNRPPSPISWGSYGD